MYVHFTQESCAEDYLHTNRGQWRSPHPHASFPYKVWHSTLCLEGRTRIWLWARCKCRIPDIIYDVDLKCTLWVHYKLSRGITFWEDHILYSSSTYWGCVVTVITWPVQMKFWLQSKFQSACWLYLPQRWSLLGRGSWLPICFGWCAGVDKMQMD